MLISLPAFNELIFPMEIATASPMRVDGDAISSIADNPQRIQKLIDSGQARPTKVMGHDMWTWRATADLHVTGCLVDNTVQFVSVYRLVQMDTLAYVNEAIYRRADGILPKGFVSDFYLSYVIGRYGAVASSDEHYAEGEAFWRKLIVLAKKQGMQTYVFDVKRQKRLPVKNHSWGSTQRKLDYRIVIRKK